MRLRETHNALQVPVFFFFFSFFSVFGQPYETLDCKSLFLMLKILQMADRSGEFRFSQGIHVRTGIRIDISISIRPKITKLGKQVHLQHLTQMGLIKQMLLTSLENIKTLYSTTRVSMATNLGRMVTYLDGILPIKSHDPLITWSCKIT